MNPLFSLRTSLLIIFLGLSATAMAQESTPAASTVPQSSAEASPVETAIKKSMTNAMKAFEELLPFINDNKAFLDEGNEEKIQAEIASLLEQFHRVESVKEAFGNEPGFAVTVRMLNEMLVDAERRFKEGKKSYAQWRLKTVSFHCVSCHVRHEEAPQSSVTAKWAGDVNALERGQFYLAIRQYEDALKNLEKAALDPELGMEKIDALRSLLVLFVRVQPNPQEAIREYSKIRAKGKLSEAEDAAVKNWLESFRKWQQEKPDEAKNLQKAEALLAQGLSKRSDAEEDTGAVELLRATAMMHSLLEGPPAPSAAERAKGLLLLGKAYFEMPRIFVDELPEKFLETCIREYPGTAEAKEAFTLYESIITAGYTGSSGMHIPKDVSRELSELRELSRRGH